MLQKCLTSFLVLAISVALLSCDVGPNSASNESGLHDGTFIDEPIIVAASDPQNSVQFVNNVYVYDFSRVALVTSHNYNDFEIAYGTPSYCDEDVYVYNYRTASWAQIGFVPVGYGCAQSPTTQTHMFSAMKLAAGDYMNESYQMRVITKMAAPTIRALQLNPGYRAIPLSHFPQISFEEITSDGQSLWLCSRWPATIYSLSLTGEILKSFLTPTDFPFGLAFDGQFLWLADGTNRIFKLTQDGAIAGQFEVPTDYPGGLAWDGSHLWLAEYEGPRQRTYSIDAIRSCLSGTAVLVDSMNTPGGGSPGLAWSGSDLLAATAKDSLYLFTRNGVVLHAYALPVVEVTDLTWDGQAIWIVNRGPNGSRARDPMITRLRIR